MLFSEPQTMYNRIRMCTIYWNEMKSPNKTQRILQGGLHMKSLNEEIMETKEKLRDEVSRSYNTIK